MGLKEELNALVALVESGEIINAPKSSLERYVAILSSSGAPMHFNNFSEVCATVRLLLLKRYTEAMDNKNTRLQKFILAFAIFTFISTGIQIYLAVAKPTIITVQSQPPPIGPGLQPIKPQGQK